MKLSTFVKIVATVIVLTILACTFLIVNRFLGRDPVAQGETAEKIAQLAPKEDEELVEIDEIRKLISRKDAPEIVLGAPALRKAMHVLQQGKFDEGKVLLESIVRKFEDTPAEVEAYRVLGEMHMDELFEHRENDPRYIEYTVKRGDTYIGIMSKNQTNFDLTMLLNDMDEKNITGLQPGQKLTLMPLKFSLRIIPRKNQLFLLDSQGAVIKMYEPVVDMTIPKRSARVDTFVGANVAHKEGKRVTPMREGYRSAQKSLKIDDLRIEIVGETDSRSKSFKGIVLSQSDMEELALLIRSGNKVEILY